jgi:hypothetical protein
MNEIHGEDEEIKVLPRRKMKAAINKLPPHKLRQLVMAMIESHFPPNVDEDLVLDAEHNADSCAGLCDALTHFHIHPVTLSKSK